MKGGQLELWYEPKIITLLNDMLNVTVGELNSGRLAISLSSARIGYAELYNVAVGIAVGRGINTLVYSTWYPLHPGCSLEGAAAQELDSLEELAGEFSVFIEDKLVKEAQPEYSRV